MGLFFVYILKSAFCLAAFYLFYKMLLSKETFHRFNRFALLGIMAASFVLPGVNVQSYFQQKSANVLLDLGNMLIEPLEVVEDTTMAGTFHWASLLLLVYVTGVACFWARHLFALANMYRLIRTGSRQIREDGTVMAIHRQDIAPFSWMHYIVISEKDMDENGEIILRHETAHIRHRHSWDLIFADMCISLQWFNPAAWLAKRELQNVHEFEADELVINQGIDAKRYQLLLIKKAVGTRLYSMANSFNHSSLKKRITMMIKKQSNPWARLKYLYVLPLAAIAVAAFARPEISSELDEISSAKVSDLSAIIKAESPKNVVADEKKTNVKGLVVDEETHLPIIGTSFLTKDVTNGTLSKLDVKKDCSDDGVFMVVEKMPEYPGGMYELMNFLGKNIKYPAEAVKANIHGRVIVQFVVMKDGSIADMVIKRGVHPLLDAEALRVLATMPKWKPGTQRGKAVNVKLTIPVTFSLEPSEKKKDEGTPLNLHILSNEKNDVLDRAQKIVNTSNSESKGTSYSLKSPIIIVDKKVIGDGPNTTKDINSENIESVVVLKGHEQINKFVSQGIPLQLSEIEIQKFKKLYNQEKNNGVLFINMKKN